MAGPDSVEGCNLDRSMRVQQCDFEDQTMSNDIPTQEKGSVVYVIKVCTVAALGGLLFGYDTGVIAGGIGFLQRHFNPDPLGGLFSRLCPRDGLSKDHNPIHYL